MSSVQTPSPRTQPLPKLAEARRVTLRDHILNIFRLVIKELRSIRSDPTMLILVVYAFSISVNTVATGAVTEATNLSVGIADEDGSELSRQIAEGLVRPTFQPAVQNCFSSSKFPRTFRPISLPSARPRFRLMSTLQP
jgi:ABC-2 type transport system permease protein